MTTFQNNLQMFQEYHQHDEAVLVPPLQHWIDNSILVSLHNAVKTTQPQLRQLSGDHHIQRRLTQKLLSEIHKFNLQPLLHKRWTRFFTTDQLNAAITNAIDNLHIVTNTFKPCTTTAILKTWLYAWCTNNRFGNYNQPCPLCHSPNSDTLRHLYNCTPLTQAARTILNQQHLPANRDYFFLTTPYSTYQYYSIPLLTINAIHIYCITNTYHSIKHSPHDDVQDTYHASLKRLLQHDPRLINTFILSQTKQLYDQHSQPITP